MAYSRVQEFLRDNPDLSIQITEANKSTETHSAISQSYIVYSIKLGELITVKRRYSEFESLRNVLVKCFLTKIIPPIPEKQTLTSNISTTTSNSLGLSKGVVGGTSKGNSLSNGNINSSVPVKTGSVPGQPSSNGNAAALSGSSSTSNSLNLIEYRKRMLAVFLNRCLRSIEGIMSNPFFISFLDPEVNFNDYLIDNSGLNKLNKYKLSVYEPSDNLDNQLYLTLPIPHTSNLSLFPELASEEQFHRFQLVLKKFEKYEFVLDTISKTNKRIIKHFNELNVELSDLGSGFNKLSLLQDSDYIEEIGKNFERKLIYSNALVELINLRFLDKLIELKNFTKTVKELIEYNRKKILQYKLIEKELYESRVKFNGYQKQQENINKIDNLIHSKNDEDETADGNGRGGNSESPITDAELQNALYINNSKNKPIIGKIPYFKKLNNALLKYTDNDPDKTRKDKMYQLKLKIYQLERQSEILEGELTKMNVDVNQEFLRFHDWFKAELQQLVIQYNVDLKEYVMNNQMY